MLEIARPEVRTRTQTQAREPGWGIVDVILGIVMLPFGIWIWMIERVVGAISGLQRH